MSILVRTDTLTEHLESADRGLANTPAAEAPSIASHLLVAVFFGVFLVPGIFLFRGGNALTAALLVGIPYVAVCFLNPFIALCYLMALYPIDEMLDMGSGAFTVSKLLAIVLALGFSVRILQTPVRVPRVLGLVLSLVIWGVVSMLGEEYGSRMFLKTFTTYILLSGIVIIVVSLMRSRRHFDQLLFYLFAITAVIALSMLLFPENYKGTGRTSVGGMNPNHLSYGLAIGLVCGIYCVARAKTKIRRFLLFVAALLIAAAVIRTHSRGTYVALAGGTVVGLVVTYRAHFLRVVGWVAIGSMLVAVLIWGSIHTGAFPQKTMQRLTEPLSEAHSGRFYIWERGLQSALEKPLTGHGLGTYVISGGLGKESHNVYLKLLVEGGIPALLIFLGMLGVLFSYCCRLRSLSLRFFATTLCSMLILRGLFLDLLTNKALWYSMAIICAAWYLNRDQEAEEWSVQLIDPSDGAVAADNGS